MAWERPFQRALRSTRRRCFHVVMNRDLGPLILAVLVCLGTFFLVTGIGGCRYSFTTREWIINARTTPTDTRIIGGLMIGFAGLLWTMRSQSPR